MDAKLLWALLCTALSIVLAGGLWRSARERRQLREHLDLASENLQRLQASFTRFAPAAVVEEIATTGEPTRGERKQVTALFADLEGFTALAEEIEPDVLVGVLNGYFEFMSDTIAEHRGRVSTFVGDGVLALYGALEPNPWQANDAARSALAMRAALTEYNRSLQAKGLPALSLGVGLHRGVGVAGLVGSRDLMEFTVVGPTVNLAARVQDLTRSHDADIILTEAVAEVLDPSFELQPLGTSQVKGVAGPVAIFGLARYRG